MFQYAAGLQLALKYNAPLRFDIRYFLRQDGASGKRKYALGPYRLTVGLPPLSGWSD